MAMKEPEVAGAYVPVLDYDPETDTFRHTEVFLTQAEIDEDIAAIRAFLDDPVGITDDGELDRMSPDAVRAVRAELDAFAARRG
jgi:hypothetical protein